MKKSSNESILCSDFDIIGVIVISIKMIKKKRKKINLEYLKIKIYTHALSQT